MNRPEDSDLVWLDEGEAKLSATKDTKIANAATFVVAKEDHTLGNLVRAQLLEDPSVLFAGYNLAVSRNPEEVENLFNTTLMGFALMETFVFLSFIVGAVIYFI